MATDGATPVVRAGALQGFDELVRRWGHDPHRLRRRHGLGGVSALDPEQMVPLPAVARLLEDAAVACGRADLGLRLGAVQDPRALGLLAVVVQGSPTVGVGLADATRFLFAHSPAYRVTVRGGHEAQVEVRFEADVGDGSPYRQFVDGCLTSMLSMMRALSGVAVVPSGVSLPHTPVAPSHTYREVFGVAVSFEQPVAALHLERRLLDARLDRGRPELRHRAIGYITSRYPPADRSTASLVRSALLATVGTASGSRDDVAGLLGLHPRTLQRRLDAEGHTFSGILDDVRRTATHRLLTETTIPLGQVAHTLGFSEHAAMSRKVRAWFDRTPTEVRQSRQG